MLTSKIVLFITTGTLVWSYSATENTHRNRAKLQDLPYVVHLRINKSGRNVTCTGSLIHPQWVLTAAHCTKGYTFIQVYALMIEAEKGIASFSKVLLVEKSISYPGFVNKLSLIGMNLYNDYSLIRLENSLDTENVGLIQLENRTWSTNKLDGKQRKCLAVGFGSAQDEDGLFVFTVNAHHGACPCKTKIHLLEKYICSTVGEKDKSSICPGDSGGPLICNGKQVGIASHTYPGHCCDLFSTRSTKHFGCDIPGTVSIFLYICPVLSWIRESVGDIIPIQPAHC